ncbi:MAG: hypothetical protein ACK55I_00930, partial [bacterium]
VPDSASTLFAFFYRPSERGNGHLECRVPQGSEHPETPSSYPGDDDCSYQYVDQHPGHTQYEHHQDHNHRRRTYQSVERN